MLQVNLPLVGTIYLQSNKFVTGVKIKATGHLKLNDSPVYLLTFFTIFVATACLQITNKYAVTLARVHNANKYGSSLYTVVTVKLNKLSKLTVCLNSFFKALVETIRKRRQDHHLLDMLTEVTRVVVDRTVAWGLKPQVPAPSYTLRRQLWLKDVDRDDKKSKTV